jgi:hypothetical protein
MPEPMRLDVQVDVMEGFHINDNVASEGLIATSIAVPEVEIASVEFPPAHERQFDFADAPLRVFEGSFTIALRLKQPPAGETVRVRLTYQACDDTTCLPPVTKQFELATR